MRHLSLLAALAGSQTAFATVHELLVSTYGHEGLYSLTFDDATEELKLAKNMSFDVSSQWIALSHDKKTLYGNSYNDDYPAWVSYAINNATSLELNGNKLRMGGDCVNSTAPGIFVTASQQYPYAVYGTPWGDDANCGIVMSVDENGALSEAIQNFTYGSTSDVHGMAVSGDGTVIYSSDDSGNALYAHGIDPHTGKLTEVFNVPAPTTGADPRQLATHSKGKYLYVATEAGNALLQYTIEENTVDLIYQNVSFGLLPSNVNSSMYTGDTVSVSKTEKYAFASARGTVGYGVNGYISAYRLSETGAIEKQLFIVGTSTGGAGSNTVTSSSFSDEYFALTDAEEGFVEIWKMASNESTASAVAKVDLVDGYCCSNVVWLS